MRSSPPSPASDRPAPAGECASRQHEALYREIIAGVSEVVFETDLEGRWTFLSPAWTEVTGWEVAASLGTPFLEFVHPEDREANVAAFRPLVAREKPRCRHEVRYRTSDGGFRWMEVRARVVLDAADAVIGTVGTLNDVTERHQVAEALQRSHTLLQTVTESSIDAIWMMDATGRFVMINSPGASMLGLTPAEVIGRRPEELFDDSTVAIMRERDAALLATRERMEETFRVTGRNGVTRSYHTTRTPWFDDQGRCIGIIGVSRDVTEQEEAEAALRASEERFREIAETIREVFYVASAGSGRLLYVSPAYEEVWRRSRDELYGDSRAFLRAVLDDDRPLVLAALERQARGEPTQTSYRIERPDGVVRMIFDRAYPVSDADGHLLRVVGIAEDVTAERRVQEELRSSEERFRLLVNGLTDHAIISLDAGGCITSWNAGAERMFGHAASAVEGCSFALLYPGEEARVGRADDDLGAARAGRGAREGWLARADGTRFWAAVHVTPLQAADGSHRGFAVLVRDLAERIRAEEQLNAVQDRFRQAQKMEAVGRLAGGIAHDFNNLLTAVLGHAELLLYRLPAGDRCRESADEIRRAAERAAELTQQLLAFSRKQVIHPRVLELADVVRDSSSILRRLIGEDVQLETSLAVHARPVFADPTQLHQVVMNLAVNARDAMPHGGRLTIETLDVLLDDAAAAAHGDMRPGRYSVLAVSDTGHGMSAETQRHIFEPFYTTKEVGKGTGLGLSTVYGIVKQSGGYVWVYSEVGVGTTFRVYLPAHAGEHQEQPDVVEVPGVSTAIGPRGTERVLVVEDEAAVRLLVVEALRECGYSVLQASGPEEALTLAEGEPEVALLLTDVVMPGMHGRALAERLGQRWPALRVLFTSGYTDHAIVAHGVLDAGVAFLRKPFSPAAVATRVRDLLDADPVAAGDAP